MLAATKKPLFDYLRAPKKSKERKTEDFLLLSLDASFLLFNAFDKSIHEAISKGLWGNYFTTLGDPPDDFFAVGVDLNNAVVAYQKSKLLDGKRKE